MLGELVEMLFHLFFDIFFLLFYFFEKYWIFETKIANMTWKEKPYAKVLLEFGFSMKSYTDFLDSRLLTRLLTPFHEGPKFRLDNHLKL